MSVPDEVRRDAERTGELICKKLMEIMDLQAENDTLLQDDRTTPFGSKQWQHASLEALQRLVAMTALQFILFEPVEWVQGNDEFNDAAERMIEIIIAQLKTLKTKDPTVTSMDPKTVETLEGKIEDAIAEIILKMGVTKLPLLPSRLTMHLMAKAAVTVYEAAVENQPPEANL